MLHKSTFIEQANRMLDASYVLIVTTALLCFSSSAICAQAAPKQPVQTNTSASQSAYQQTGALTSPQPQENPEFTILLDPAHGGSDPGALLASHSPEKTYTLDLAIRLHALLNAREIPSTLTRSDDVLLNNDARANLANHTHAAACLLLHASSSGTGIHLYTSSLAASTASTGVQDRRRLFLPWRTAQSGYITQSLRLESDINVALAQNHLPVLLARTSLMPLDSMTCPAVAVEVAPLSAKTPLSDAAYEEQIAEALASALAAWRADWRAQQ